MSQPGRFGSGWAPDESALIRRIEDLERTVREGFAARTLESSSIGAGGLQVVNQGSIIVKDGGTVRVEDASGGRAVTLGLLSDSSFGMSVNDPISGTELPLSRLAFGLAGASASGTLAHGTKGVWNTDPSVSVTVTTSTGKLLVEVGAELTLGNPTGTDLLSAYYGFSIAGPTNVAANTTDAVRSSFGSFPYRGSKQTLVTGLAPGSYVVTGAYMATTSGSNALPTQVDTSGRSLVVFPY